MGKRLPGEDSKPTVSATDPQGLLISVGAIKGKTSISPRRLTWGLVAALLSGLLGVAVYASTTWVGHTGPELLVYFAMPEWVLILCGHLLSGVTAVAGLVLLLPPLVRKISRNWLRRLAAVLAVLAAAAAALPWLLYFIGMALNAASATYTKVPAESGESVIVEQSGFDRGAYAVYGQESSWLWQRRIGWEAAKEVFDPKDCTLMAGKAALVLTCGADSIVVPSVGH